MPCAYVYIIRCRGGSLYTGIARSVCRRLRQHTEKSPACAKYTRSHPVRSARGAVARAGSRIRGADGVRRQAAPA